MTDIVQIAAGLTKAQIDTILGHMVEIPPEEADELERLGLKGKSFVEEVVVYKRVWPITETGLAVRARLLANKEPNDA